MRIAWFARIADGWENVRNSYLLLPALMLLAGIGCAIGMLYLDEILLRLNVQVPWVTTLTASAGRTILSTLAGSMATIAGVVFSIDVVALQLAASQFGPHVMRGFLSDRGSQVSLGTFVGTFVYALVVLVSGRAHGAFVPYAAIYFGILLGIGAMVVLVYFINHIANLIRVESVIASLARSLAEATETVFPEHLGRDDERTGPQRQQAEAIAVSGHPVAAEAAGYVRRIDDGALMALASSADIRIGLHARPGDFVVPGTVLMTVGPPEQLAPGTASDLRAVVVLGDRRTPYQDVPYALQELVEIALRALSPGINAPFTAIPAIDTIAAGLVKLAGRRMPALHRADKAGVVRVVVDRGDSMVALASGALGPIASAARGHAAVTARVIEAALLVASRTAGDADREALRAFADAVAEEAAVGMQNDRDRMQVAAAHRTARARLAGAACDGVVFRAAAPTAAPAASRERRTAARPGS